MKNLKLLFIILVILSFSFQNYNLFADVTEVGSITEMEAVLENIYSLVDQGDITTDILYGSKITYTDFYSFRGIPEDSVVSNSIFRQIYADLYAFYDAASVLLSLEELDQHYNSYINSNDAIPFPFKLKEVNLIMI